MIAEYLPLALVAFVAALATLPLLNWLAFGCDWIDRPDERKAHDGSIPLTGGATIAIAMILALSYGALLLEPGLVTPMLTLGGWPLLPWPSGAAGLLAGLVLCFAIGTWDDRFPLRARYRLYAQLAAASCAIIGGNVLTTMGTTFSPLAIGLSVFAIPVTLVALTGIVNAYNMSDGLDGLCGGYVAIALAAFTVCAALITVPDMTMAPGAAPSHPALHELGPIILPCLGAVTGFLFYNMRHRWRDQAVSFLGDAGSLSLGFFVGWIAVRLASGYGPVSLPPVTAVWIVALPLIDMFACMIRRPLEGRTPMSADRRHIHHLLMSRGLSVRQSVATLHAVSASFAALGILAWQASVPDYLMFWSLVAIFAAYCVLSISYWRHAATSPQRPPDSQIGAVNQPGPGNQPTAVEGSQSLSV